nr:MAG TPA: hypothetical protein [Caudoviricetes sp.]
MSIYSKLYPAFLFQIKQISSNSPIIGTQTKKAHRLRQALNYLNSLKISGKP